MRNFLKYTLGVIGFLLMSFNVNAQITFNTDWIMTDNRYDNYDVDAYSEVNGNPYLLRDWSKGSVVSGQAILKDQMLKYDEVANRLFVKGSDGSTKTFKNVISSFTIMDGNKERTFSAGFVGGVDNNNFTFFEILTNGKIKFLKRNIKVISVNKEYSGKEVKNITSEVKYYISRPESAPMIFKLSEKSILDVFTEKQAEIKAYLTKNKLNLKKEQDVSTLIEYYNTIL